MTVYQWNQSVDKIFQIFWFNWEENREYVIRMKLTPVRIPIVTHNHNTLYGFFINVTLNWITNSLIMCSLLHSIKYPITENKKFTWPSFSAHSECHGSSSSVKCCCCCFFGNNQLWFICLCKCTERTFPIDVNRKQENG